MEQAHTGGCTASQYGYLPSGGFGEPPKTEVIRRMNVDFPHPACRLEHVIFGMALKRALLRDGAVS